MKYIPPEPKIDLYKDGFPDTDLLDRSETGKQLSSLLENIEDPLVVALDGAWGSGKSFFLKCWVGEHTNNYANTTTVYFDAFEHDFLDDPLIALTGAIKERFEQSKQSPTQKKHWRKASAAAAKLAKPAARISLAIATAGASEGANSAVNAALEAGSEELEAAADSFWKKEDGKRAAMKQFRQALIAMTDTDSKDGDPRKLVVVIDELDRCRPDYALSLLEVTKHFFAIPNVHFVLGVNSEELENSVKARYGSRVNARKYLEKFVSVTINLPNIVKSSHAREPSFVVYFAKNAKAMELPEGVADDLADMLRLLDPESSTIRAIQKLLTEIALIPKNDNGLLLLTRAETALLVGLLVLKVLYPTVYAKAKRNELSFEEIEAVMGEPENMDYRLESWREFAIDTWRFTLSPDYIDPDGVPTERRLQIGRRHISDLVQNKLEVWNIGVTQQA